jgi:hypothetical protein
MQCQRSDRGVLRFANDLARSRIANKVGPETPTSSYASANVRKPPKGQQSQCHANRRCDHDARRHVGGRGASCQGSTFNACQRRLATGSQPLGRSPARRDLPIRHSAPRPGGRWLTPHHRGSRGRRRDACSRTPGAPPRVQKHLRSCTFVAPASPAKFPPQNGTQHARRQQ